MVAWLEYLAGEALDMEESAALRYGMYKGSKAVRPPGGASACQSAGIQRLVGQTRRWWWRRGGGGGARFARDEGVWKETRAALAAGGGTRADWDLVSQMDPDAPGRQGKALHPDNANDEQRLLARVWRLVRAGGACAASHLALLARHAPCKDIRADWL